MPVPSYPKPKEFITAKEKTLGDVVLSQGRLFIVPLNQRPWAWKDARDVQHFLDDFERILTAFFDPDTSPRWERRSDVTHAPHFFGTFVFYKKARKKFEIFDGQQRLTAVFMLCAVLHEIANEVKDYKGGHQQRANRIYGGFDNWLRISPTDDIPRLCPNTFFDELFKALLFQLDDESRQKALKELPDTVRNHAITKKLEKSFYHIRTWIREKMNSCSAMDRTNFLSASYDVLKELFSCIETLIHNEQHSYEVFGCLNARGERLTAADNLKNDLFTVSDRSIHEDISKQWNRIGENVPNQDIGEFLRRRHIALKGPCKKEDTHQRIKKEEIDQKEIKALVNDWYEDSVLIRRLTNREASLAKKMTRDRIEVIFDLLNVGLAQIPLLAAAKRFLPDDKDSFEKCVRLIEVFVFRSLTIERVDTQELERKLGEAARIVINHGSVSSLEGYFKKQIDNAHFEEMFATHTEKRVKVQYYILRELEIHLLGKGVVAGVVPNDHHEAKNHIEHVLPKSLSNTNGREHEWCWARKEREKYKNLINRLGNLLLLEGDINKEVGNHEIVVKQTGQYQKKKSGRIKSIKCYQQSALKWPKKLANQKDWPQWTEKEINERQSQMAKEALKIWAI